jgi:hypothetical protein
MANTDSALERLRTHVLSTEPVRQEDISLDDALRVQVAHERSVRLRTLLAALSTQMEDERKMRRSYATALLCLLYIEVIAIFAAFFMVAANIIHAEPWMASTFLVTAFLQSAGLVALVVKYLFPDRSIDVLRLAELETNTESLAAIPSIEGGRARGSTPKS